MPYPPNTWNVGDKITKTKLDRLEQAAKAGADAAEKDYAPNAPVIASGADAVEARGKIHAASTAQASWAGLPGRPAFVASGVDPAGARSSISAISEPDARRRFMPSIVLNSYYGSYGNGDDQEAFEAAFDHAKQLGGAKVVIPSGYNPVVQQLVLARGIELCSNGYFQTFGRDGNVSRIIQAPGVNDDTVVFDNDVLTQYGASRPFVGPLAIHDLVFSKPAGAGGHHIAVRTEDGREAKIQDFTTLERLGFRGGGGSGIYVNGGSPIRLYKLAGIGLGGYVVEMVDLRRDINHGDIHQVSVIDVSGDACMGYQETGYGATVLLKGTMAHTTQSFRDIKSEYRVRYPSDGGDPESTPQENKKRGNFHAIILEDCESSIEISGVGHIATGSTATTEQPQRPGHAVMIKGTKRPDLSWRAVRCRVTPAQTIGVLPADVRDDVHKVSYFETNGELGPQMDAKATASIGLSSGESTIPRRNVTGGAATLSAGQCRLTYFTAERTETINSIRTATGTQVQAGATLCRLGVYEVADNGDLTLVASTANDTVLWSVASQVYGKNFTAPFLKRKRQRYAVAALVVGATTPPNVMGQTTLLGPEAAQPPRLCGTVSGQTDLPATITAANVGETTIQVYAALGV